MDIYKLKLTVLQQEILRFLMIHSGIKFTQNQIATSLDVSPAAVSKSLPILRNKDYVKIVKDQTTKRLSIILNRDNLRIVDLKRIENLKLLVESGFMDYLRENLPGKQIILFGSYSRGEDIERSDIDIAVIGKEKVIEVKNFEKRLKRNININFYNTMPTDENLKNNIMRSIMLEG